MTRLPSSLRLALPAYLALLLLLALLGVTNQSLLTKQVRLMDAKEELTARVADTRRQAARVNGPTAVAEWARSRGMIPVPEARDSVLVAPESPTDRPLPTPSLEIRTVWR